MDSILAATKDQRSRDEVVATYVADSASLSDKLDRFASLAARLCDAPVGFLSLVEADRQCFVGKYGSTMQQTPRDQSFCAHAMLLDEPMVIGDARDDPRFVDNPLVTGDPQIRFYAGYPLKTRTGTPLGSLCVIDFVPRENLTAQQLDDLGILAEAALAEIEVAHDARKTAARENAVKNRIAELKQQFDILADALPPLVWSTDAQGQSDYFNQRWCDYTGYPAEDSYGSKWLDRLHPDDLPHTREAWDTAVKTGKAYQTQYRVRSSEGTYRWFLVRGLPIEGTDGTVTRWIGTCTDIEDQKETELQLSMLSRELSHRIKNIFAVISGLISLTRRNRPEIAEAAAELQERVLALGRAHDYVRSDMPGSELLKRNSTLHGMLTALLSPYQNGERTRIQITGDDAAIDDRSATALALFFHELATNAAKYGALSVNEGHIRIDVTQGEPVLMRWTESGGPSVLPSAKHGFGASLVEMSISRQLAGALEYEWKEEGVVVTAAIPSRSLVR